MNKALLNQYGISFYKQSNGNIKTSAISPNLDIYMYMFSRSKNEVERFLITINLALSRNYNSIDEDDKTWSKEVGFDLYIGTILNNTTFELYMADNYESTVEEFPLEDIREIFNSLLEFINNNAH